MATLVGLGILPGALLLGSNTWLRVRAGKDLAFALTLFLMLGTLTDLSIGLLFGSLRVQTWACWAGYVALSAFLWVVGTRAGRALSQSPHFWHEWLRPPWSIVKPLAYACTMGAFLAVCLAIASDPLIEWDARSIWFFHGKVIFFDGGLRPSDFWLNDEYGWSHKPYPPLIPVLAARAADFTAGTWNEFAPKLGLVPLACAGFFGLLVIAQSPRELALLVLATLAVLGSQLWSGMADGWLALEGCIAIYALSRWAETGDRNDLLFGCAALAIALCLKNEGQLLFAVGVPLLVYGGYRQRRQLQFRDAAILLVLSPFALWIWKKPELPAIGDLEGGDLLARALGVMAHWPQMTHRLAVLIQSAYQSTFLLESFAAFVFLVAWKGVDRISAALAVAAALYTLGMIMVYFGTPYDFAWHVKTSLDRVLMLPTLLLLAGLLRVLETRSKSHVRSNSLGFDFH